MSEQYLFRPAGLGMLRAPVHPAGTHPCAAPGDGGRADGPVAALRALADGPIVREAVEIASPPLAGVLTKVLDEGQDATPDRLHRAVRALTSYRLRMSTRATPFGLMAGVAPVRFTAPGEPPRVRLGAAHRRAVRPDRAWLTGLVTEWERRPEVLRQLHVVVNSLCRVRGGRLVLSQVPHSGRDGAERKTRPVQEVSLRHSKVVAAVRELAHRPVLGADLVTALQQRFPGLTEEAADGLIGQLVRADVLLTQARPPLEEADPLGYVLDVCGTIGGGDLPELAELDAVRKELLRYAESPLGDGVPELRDVAARMRRLRPGADLLQVDLALDAEVRLPAAVAEEAVRAAALLWRLSPDTAGPAHLREYHQAFLERYGTDRAVPLTELLDPDAGLGAPAGYRRPPSPRTAPGDVPDQERARALAALAQEALLTGACEVVLDDDHPFVRRLAEDGDGAPETLEICGRLLAPDADALAAGDFRLVLANGSRQAGSLLGRFGYLFDARSAGDLAALVRPDGAPGQPSPGADGAVRAQVAVRPGDVRIGNIAQVPRLLDHLLPVGCYADPGDPSVLDPRDLAVRADLDGLWLVDTATGGRVEPTVLHMLNVEECLPNVSRFLCEIAASGRRTWSMWSWGGAAVLPRLPRVRYGRTVLSAALWTPGPELRAPEPPFAQWWEAFRDWQRRWAVPDRVQAGWGDRFVRLDLTRPDHARLLRRELLRGDRVHLREVPEENGLPDGWLHGPDGPHHAEVVIPLRAVPGAHTPGVKPRAARRPLPRRAPAVHFPGGDWLHLSLYAPADRHEELLAVHLAPLLGELPDCVDRWFFLRYTDGDGPHLRLRFHGPAAALGRDLQPRLHDATSALHAAGLTRRAVWDSYDPELERYGGPEAMAAAERVFHADSVAVLEQLRRRHARREPAEPLLVAAAGFADLARAFHAADGAERGGPAGADWLVRRIPKDEERQRGFRERRREALPLVDPYRAGPAGDADGTLRTLWRRRAEATARYGALLRALGERSWSDPDQALSSLLHLHHNRLIGTDRPAELLAHAVARGAAQAHTDRRRHTR
ncbi:lantibiotic dehydratase [Streptomyces catenulae]|uniref:Lantibiotic dehydratase n=1 Tax=Streptomyces catenulae TaxID=66875 RepID=A0ABV2YXI3_9ACTN|nr:lantibiotic dehydratase [Streptomyces catenulae]